MFEGLDDIDWASLEHAYGSAEDVPDLVRRLNSDDAEERDQAFYDAFGNIFHQGTRYQATAPTVPFLLEILDRPDYEAHDDMMYLLAHLIMGYGEAYLPEGFMPTIAGMRYDLNQLRARSEDERDEEDDDEWASDEDWLTWLVAITDEVRRGVPRVIRHLGSDDERVRISATFLLSWLPEDFDLFAPSLWQLVNDDPSDHVRADALIALAIAGDEAAFAEYVPEVEALLSDGEPVVQFAAAIALGTRATDEAPDAVVQVLLEAIAREGADEERDEDDFWMIPWYDGEAGAYATEVLRVVSADAPERATHAVSEALGGMKTLQAANAATSIVAMLFPAGFEGESAEDLDPLQRMFLERLAETPNPWMLGDAEFANFSLTMGDFGLPNSMEKMREFVGDE